MKTLYVADLDGTLLTTDGRLSQKTKSTLNSLIEHGLMFTLNTSRTPKSAARFLDELNLNLPAIMMDGSAFFNKKTNSFSEFLPLSTPSARKVVAAAKSAGCEPFWFGFAEGEISVKYTSCSLAESQKFMLARRSYYKSFEKQEYLNPSAASLYIICLGNRENLERLKLKIDQIPDAASCIFISENADCYLEVYSRNAGKWNATRRLKEKLGADRVVCFGDNLNDIEMLENADLGVAVSSGYTAAKNAADIVIGSCDSDAVAEYLMIDWSRQL